MLGTDREGDGAQRLLAATPGAFPVGCPVVCLISLDWKGFTRADRRKSGCFSQGLYSATLSSDRNDVARVCRDEEVPATGPLKTWASSKPQESRSLIMVLSGLVTSGGSPLDVSCGFFRRFVDGGAAPRKGAGSVSQDGLRRPAAALRNGVRQAADGLGGAMQRLPPNRDHITNRAVRECDECTEPISHQ